MCDSLGIGEAMEDLETFDVDFQACMYGSIRNKWIRLVASREDFLQLLKECDGKRLHAA